MPKLKADHFYRGPRKFMMPFSANFRLNWVVLTLSLSLTANMSSCGRNHGSRGVTPADPDLPLTVAQGPEIESYPFDDPDCQNKPSADNLSGLKISSVAIDRWQDGSVSRQTESVEQLDLSAFPLRSRYVNEVSFGTIFRRSCNAKKASPPDCLDENSNEQRWSEVTRGSPVRVCMSSITPGRKSLEHIALSAILAVEKTGQRMAQYLPSAQDISGLTVLAAPSFESRWTPWTTGAQSGSYLNYLSENLAYFPPTSGTPPFIAILPKNTGDGNPTRLWESQFVIAHEFSHHLELVLGAHRFDEDRSIIRRAASEGFADIMAYASQGASSSTLEGMPCIGHDRSPQKHQFNNGMDKIIDDALLNRASPKPAFDSYTFADGLDQSKSICRGVLPHSAHGIGAILAHWVADFASATPGYDADKAKAIALLSIAWLKNLDQEIGAGSSSPKQDLIGITKALETSVEQRYSVANIELTDNLKILLCQKMRLGFPALKEVSWFGRTGC